MIAIANIGIGTPQTVFNMLQYLRYKVEIVSDARYLHNNYSHLIIPGVGHFSEGTRKLDQSGWRNSIQDFSIGKPILGICLGMQLLGISSEEGPGQGLSLIDFRVAKFSKSKTPISFHMGWNTVKWVNSSIGDESDRFYFVHGYALNESNKYTVGTTFFGENFSSVIKRDHIWGFQFHPEKSHKFGMAAFKKFIEEN